MTTKKKIGPETKAVSKEEYQATAAGSGGLASGARYTLHQDMAVGVTFALSAESEDSAGEYIYDIWVGKDFLNKMRERANYIKDE